MKYDESLEYYDTAIKQITQNSNLKSICYSNRAAVNLAIGNFGKVVEDCNEAIKLDDNNIKAYWRAGSAFFELEKFQDTKKYCKNGLSVFSFLL